MKQRHPVIVLGMHRSGTSALAAGLEHLGFHLGAQLYPQNEWNRKGYFEEERIVAYNNVLLMQLGRRWDAPLPPNEIECAGLLPRVSNATELLENLFATCEQWGFKDPRMCILQPFWQQAFEHLALEPRILIALRDPAAVAHSLRRRDGIAGHRGGWLWLTHLIGALSYVNKPGQARFVKFDDLLDRPARVLEELADWLGICPDSGRIASFAGEFIEPELARRPPPLDLPSLVVQAHAVLQHAAAQRMDPFDFRSTAPWASILNDYAAVAEPMLQAAQQLWLGDGQLDLLEQRNEALSRGLSQAERFATERLHLLEQADARIDELQTALASAQGLAESRLLIEKDLRCALQRAETLAGERLSALSGAQQRGDALDCALAQAQVLAHERLDVLQAMDRRLAQLDQALLGTSELATLRLNEMARLDRHLRERDAALSHAQHVAGQLQEENARQSTELEMAQESLRQAHRHAAQLGKQLELQAQSLAALEKRLLETEQDRHTLQAQLRELQSSAVWKFLRWTGVIK